MADLEKSGETFNSKIRLVILVVFFLSVHYLHETFSLCGFRCGKTGSRVGWERKINL